MSTFETKAFERPGNQECAIVGETGYQNDYGGCQITLTMRTLTPPADARGVS